jgi:nucleotide-binding universal stress UspA family protein
LPQNYLLDLKDGAEKALDRLIPADWQARHKVRRATRLGNPASEIIRYASEHQIDLIVVGTHGRGAMAHLLLGSVAERVVRQAQCPVLTIRPAR